jgi:uncharacterized protein RhaS with RHS repeats
MMHPGNVKAVISAVWTQVERRRDYVYDKLHRVTSTTGRQPVTLADDVLGRVSTVIDGMLRTTRYAFDAFVRPTKTTEAWGTTLQRDTIYSYIDVAWIVDISDPMGHRTRYTDNSFDQLVKVMRRSG